MAHLAPWCCSPALGRTRIVRAPGLSETVSVGVLGELVRTGTTAARRCQDTTTGQMLAENVINETVIGIRQMAPAQGTFPEAPEWSFNLDVQPGDQPNLLILGVTVVHQDGSQNKGRQSIVSWLCSR